MTTTVESSGLTFLCDDPIEEWRAKSLLETEPGTIAWIDTMPAGSVFYDIGANIGVYTLYAAKRGVKVYAFEAHAANALSLARNVVANGLQDRVTVFQALLQSGMGWQSFHYRSERAGSSGSQGWKPIDDNGDAFKPGCVIVMWGAALSTVPCRQEPHYIKIDVDGSELDILKGVGGERLRGLKSAQVETHPKRRTETDCFMADNAFVLDHRHYTQAGQRQIDMGAGPETVICNSVYVRAA